MTTAPRLRVAVTGGTSGLGLALVRELTAAARTWRSWRAPRTRAAVAREQPSAHGIVGDVAQKDDIYPIALQILGELGGLDVLVNNASSLGPAPLALLADTDCEDFELALATNVLGPFRLTKALLGALAASAREGRGAVVLNISSDAAVNAYPTWGAYGASKAALRHMSAIWDEELASEGVRLPVARSRRHGHAAARARGARCRSGDAEAAGSSRARARRRDRTPALPRRDAARLASDESRGIDPPSSAPHDAKLLAIDCRVDDGRVTHARVELRRFAARRRSRDRERRRDTAGQPRRSPLPTGGDVEVRLAVATVRLSPDDVENFTAVVFGAGDFHTRTEDRPAPPPLAPGDGLALGPLRATIDRCARPSASRVAAVRGPAGRDLVGPRAARAADSVRAHRDAAGALGCVDADRGFAGRLRAAVRRVRRSTGGRWRRCATGGIEFATITLAAGISSTGDPELDARLPFDEPYHIPAGDGGTPINRTRSRRAERSWRSARPSFARSSTRPTNRAAFERGDGIATRRIGRTTRCASVDAILSGVHEPGTSHYQLLRAFADDDTLQKADALMSALGYRTHEFGDSRPDQFLLLTALVAESWNGSRFQSRNVQTRFHESRCSRVFSGCHVLGSTRRSKVCPPGGLS